MKKKRKLLMRLLQLFSIVLASQFLIVSCEGNGEGAKDLNTLAPQGGDETTSDDKSSKASTSDDESKASTSDDEDKGGKHNDVKPQASTAPAQGEAQKPQASTAPAQGEAQKPQASTAPAQGEAQKPQASTAPAQGEAQKPQASTAPAQGEAQKPQGSTAPAQSNESKGGDAPAQSNESKGGDAPAQSNESKGGKPNDVKAKVPGKIKKIEELRGKFTLDKDQYAAFVATKDGNYPDGKLFFNNLNDLNAGCEKALKDLREENDENTLNAMFNDTNNGAKYDTAGSVYRAIHDLEAAIAYQKEKANSNK